MFGDNDVLLNFFTEFIRYQYNIQITQELIDSLTSGFELIKVIESQFNKLMANIVLLTVSIIFIRVSMKRFKDYYYVK